MIIQCSFLSINLPTQKSCNEKINKRNIVIIAEKVEDKCIYKISVKKYNKYIRILSKIPTQYILNRFDNNASKYKKITKKYNSFINYFLNLMKERNISKFSTYLVNTIKNKKEEGVKILLGLIFSLSIQKDISRILDYFMMDNVSKIISNNLQLKNLSFGLLSIELFNREGYNRSIVLQILSKADLPTSFFCRKYKEENLSIDELHICLTNFNIQDKNWIKEILYSNFSFSTKAYIINTSSSKKISGMENIFIDYARRYLLDKKTDKDAVELFRSILSYLGDHPTRNGFEFATKVTLNSKLPWVLRHEAITSLDEMKEFSNEAFFIYIKALKDADMQMRSHATSFLGNLLLPKALPYLKEIAKNDFYTIARAYAVEAIGKIGQKKENKFLLSLLNDPAPLVKLTALQALLKNHYPKINLNPLIDFLNKTENIFLAEDMMAKTLCFEILQEFASPEISKLLIDIGKKEQNPTNLFLINDILNNIFSLEYKLPQNMDESAKNNMIQFWTRIYSIYRKNITRKIPLNYSGLKNIITLISKNCNGKKLCIIKTKYLFRSYTNKLFSKIKNFDTYHISIYVNNKKLMLKKIDNKKSKFSFSFIYPAEEKLNILIETNINGRIFKRKTQVQ